MTFSDWMDWYMGSIVLTLVAVMGTALYEEWLCASRGEPPMHTHDKVVEAYYVAIILSVIPVVNVLVLLFIMSYFCGYHVSGIWTEKRGNPNG